MSTAMDMFLSASDSMSFPEILDIDIKTEIDTLVGGHNDFSGFNFNEMPLEIDDFNWFNSNSNHSNLDFSGGEDGGPAMVNPNAVMPVMSLPHSIRSPSPSIKESHLTFSPATIKLPGTKPEAASIKKDLRLRLEEVHAKKPLPVLKTIQKTTPIIIAKQPVGKTLSRPQTILFKNPVQRQVAPAPVSLAHVNAVATLRTVAPATVNRRVQPRVVYEEPGQPFPKPAYSYSCLIAMALKNSRSGSLPVSEIYSFMCKHFPYFKTAPNGWKNSVRHNLSLNKCFEKIEKPALNGAQRKGCLWAMNPAKIIKMDEEVQKWSRKDPHAIKKAMVNPEHLELLERGEMKFASSYDETDHFGDSCGSAEEQSEASDSEHEQETEDNLNGQYNMQPKEEDMSDLEIESDGGYEEEMMDDHQELLVEVALAQQELLDYGRTVNNKRRKMYIYKHYSNDN